MSHCNEATRHHRRLLIYPHRMKVTLSARIVLLSSTASQSSTGQEILAKWIGPILIRRP